jgi:hypothetical protein
VQIEHLYDLLATSQSVAQTILTLLHPRYAAEQSCGYPYCAQKGQGYADGGKGAHDKDGVDDAMLM